MEQLPLELLLDVIKPLLRKDKKTLRRVSKSLSVVATPLVFDSVYLSHDREDLINATLTLEKYAPSINTIVLSPINYLPLIKYRYRDLVKSKLGLTERSRSPYGWRFEEHVNMGYQALNTVSNMSNTPSGDLIEVVFRSILEDSPNLRKIVVTDRRRYEKFPMARYCRWRFCDMPAEKHETFQLTSMQCSDLSQSRISTGRTLPWIRNVISETGSNLRELIVEHENTEESLALTAMQTFLCFTEALIENPDLMSKLTNLKLSLDDCRVGRGNYVYRDHAQFSTRMVARNLAYANNLEKLSLTIVNCYIENHAKMSPDMFHYILQGCRFPKLRIFVLDGCAMESDEFMEFLDGSPELRHLVLASCLLKGCDWARLLELIKAKTHLTALMLVNLLGYYWGGSTNPTRYLTRFADYDGAVERFMLHGGPNPFVCRSGEDYGKIWRPKADPAISEAAARKVGWYHDTYF